MNLTELRQVAYLGDDHVRGPIKAVILRLHGLGSAEFRQNLEPEEYVWAMNGGLVVLPYYGPWSWMNRQARQMVDQVVEGVYREFKLDPSVPLIPVGTSMGGCSVLLYCRYGKHPAVACSASAPPCDMPFSVSERPDIPRTLKMAFWGYPEPFDQVLREHSPLHQVGAMPDIPYFFLHGYDDVAVHKQPHSDKMVAALRQRGFKVEYHEVPGYGHGGVMPSAVLRRKIDFVLEAFGK
jgi:dipeptidyl aminopeptidase/acylaminoacyl peptidase